MRFSRPLFSIAVISAAVFVLLAKATAPDSPATLAATPPMGWNSWDSFGESVAETDVRANALWMAQHLKKFGWQYIVVDMGWYVTNHSAGSNAENAQFSMDEFGRFTPAVNSIPSAAKGASFKPLADYIHSLGLKFGIHILRGIPKEAVRKNLPIAGSSFHAADAATTSDTCPWNPFNYGLDASKPAAQAYYDSIAQQYAGWGVDFLKVDCIADHPYKGDEIRILSQALRKTDRPIVLSLSPGPAAFENAEELSKYAQMWRISDDVWDLWHSDKQFPSGIENQFARAAKWAQFSGPGHWPDADMLPLGRLEPVAGWEQPRATRLTHDEQRTQLTLWSIFRSPLMMGGNLTLCDKWTESLLSNPEVIDVNQHSRANHPVMQTDKMAFWYAHTVSDEEYYVAVFNLSDFILSSEISWTDAGLPGGKYSLRDLWERKNLGPVDLLKVKLAPHASVLYKVSKR
jgi:alpha-galactosidase